MFTKQIIQTEENLSIKALIEEGFKIAKSLGYNSVFVVGDPNYYNRLGFLETVHFNITNINSTPDKLFMCYQLEENSLKNITGKIDVSLQNLN